MGYSMAVGSFSAKQITTTAPRVTTATRYPAPTKGMDIRVAVSEGDPDYCIFAYNLTPYDYGMRVRNGYREWQVDIDNGASVGIHSIIPHSGIDVSGADDRLFAVTNEGIWDVTGAGGTPVLKIAFTNTTPDAGYGVYSAYTTQSGDQLLFFADSLNGLFTYDPLLNTWVQSAGINGPDVTKINFVMVHKQRVWFVEQNSTKAWYLPVASPSGAATEFNFGAKFHHGGNLVGIFNWTIDGGAGVDDYMVAISRTGDVLPYAGEDPSSADTWRLVGSYYVGEIPRGTRFATENGGELYVLSINGIISLSDLLRGVDSTTADKAGNDSNISAKISGSIRNVMRETITEFGWGIRIAPSTGGLIVDSPKQPSILPQQFIYNLGSSAWGLWRGVPMLCFDEYKGSVVFGDIQSRVLLMDVFVDELRLEAPVGETNGQDVLFSVLTSYQPMGMPGVYKRVKFVRPDFVAKHEPSYRTTVRYDYDIDEAAASLPAPDGSNDTWDTGVWDNAIWANSTFQPYNDIQGSWGKGRYVAIAMTGGARSDTRFIGWDVTFDSGGVF